MNYGKLRDMIEAAIEQAEAEAPEVDALLDDLFKDWSDKDVDSALDRAEAACKKHGISKPGFLGLMTSFVGRLIARGDLSVHCGVYHEREVPTEDDPDHDAKLEELEQGWSCSDPPLKLSRGMDIGPDYMGFSGDTTRGHHVIIYFFEAKKTQR